MIANNCWTIPIPCYGKEWGFFYNIYTKLDKLTVVIYTSVIMISLVVKFSPEYEVERVKGALERLQWFKDNGYNVKFPESMVVNPDIDISEDQIKMAVDAEYNEDDFKIKEAYLLENWHKIIDDASAELAKTYLHAEDLYTIYLTKYGVGGGYDYPDTVIVNAGSFGQGLLRMVFHEIVHLMIHTWITEYKVSHWQKERIVDLLMMKFIPSVSRTQQIPTEVTEPVDRIFDEHYPNIELIVKNVGLLPLCMRASCC